MFEDMTRVGTGRLFDGPCVSLGSARPRPVRVVSFPSFVVRSDPSPPSDQRLACSGSTGTPLSSLRPRHRESFDRVGGRDRTCESFRLLLVPF